MSATGIEGFLEKVAKDESFTTKLFEAVKGAQGGDVPAAVVAFGAANGFTFSKGEAVQAGKSLEAAVKQAEGAELSEEELEAVSGGVAWGAVAKVAIKAAPVVISVASQVNWKSVGSSVKSFFSGW